MSTPTSKSEKPAAETSKQKTARERSAAALRENLKRRKTQARQQARSSEKQSQAQAEDSQ